MKQQTLVEFTLLRFFSTGSLVRNNKYYFNTEYAMFA